MTATQTTTYEELPYSNNAFHDSHPDTLATVALLHGMSSPDVTRCRVLELGCGRGGNLLPMAEGLPESTFVGIDLSPRQIEEAQSHTDSLGFRNVEFHVMDILDASDRLGTFDYIVAHGVYSWVPPHVQESLLRLCASSLSPNGVAYVSYNTYPGWHYRGVVRDMLCYHVSPDAPASVQLDQARSLLDFVIKVIPAPDSIRSQLVKEECEYVLGQGDNSVYHDQLEPDNHPCYFADFAGRASALGLEFVAEVRSEPLVERLSGAVHEAIRKVVRGDRIRYEQHLDFLIHRTFRRSLLCRQGVPVLEEPSAEKVVQCHFTGGATCAQEEPDLASSEALAFQIAEGVSMETAHPLVKAALFTLQRNGPLAMSFEALAGAVADCLWRTDDPQFRAELAGVLVAAYRRDLVKVHVRAARFHPHLSERPLASPVARLQAQGDSSVTNREHRSYLLDPVDRLLLTLMDGTRTRQELAEILARRVRCGELTILTDGGVPPDEGELLACCQQSFQDRASNLARSGFLVG